MSTLTKNWSVEKICAIIRKLDEKIDLHGEDLPIDFSSYGWFLGHYCFVEPKAFGFNGKFCNDYHTKEKEDLNVIRHQYAHYYDDIARCK